MVVFWCGGFETLQKALNKHEGVFEQWLSQGFQADMDYLENMQEDRFHPSNKLPDIKSVIVLGAWYGPDGGPGRGPNGRPNGLVARYARGRDYHKVLKKKLIELADWLKSPRP